MYDDLGIILDYKLDNTLDYRDYTLGYNWDYNQDDRPKYRLYYIKYTKQKTRL